MIGNLLMFNGVDLQFFMINEDFEKTEITLTVMTCYAGIDGG